MIFVSRKTIEKAVHGFRYDGGWVGFEATVCVPDCFISLDLSHGKNVSDPYINSEPMVQIFCAMRLADGLVTVLFSGYCLCSVLIYFVRFFTWKKCVRSLFAIHVYQ